jgi:hypothetical protein
MKINENVVATTKDWATDGMSITAYDPSSMTRVEVEVIEPARPLIYPRLIEPE